MMTLVTLVCLQHLKDYGVHWGSPQTPGSTTMLRNLRWRYLLKVFKVGFSGHFFGTNPASLLGTGICLNADY